MDLLDYSLEKLLTLVTIFSGVTGLALATEAHTRTTDTMAVFATNTGGWDPVSTGRNHHATFKTYKERGSSVSRADYIFLQKWAREDK